MLDWLLDHIGLDKLRHFGICLVIAAFGGLLAILLGGNTASAVFTALYSAIGVGLCKEFADWQHDCEFGLWDLLADVCGAIVGALLAALVALG